VILMGRMAKATPRTKKATTFRMEQTYTQVALPRLPIC
jgi:hypothetical protein